MTPRARAHAAFVMAAILVAPAWSSAPRNGSPAAATGDSRALGIIERAIEAHGGRQAWLGKKDAAFTTTWTHYRGGQRSFTSRYLVKFPIDSGPVRTVVEGDENGKPVLMGISGSRSWFVVGEEHYEDLESLRANRAFVRRAYGLLALPFRLEDPSYSYSYDGEEVRAGAVMDRVRVEHGLEPPSLYLFDRETGRLAGLGSPVSHPPTAMVSQNHDFIQVDGILIPRVQVYERVDALTGGRSKALTVSVNDVRFGNGFSAETFEPPPRQ